MAKFFKEILSRLGELIRRHPLITQIILLAALSLSYLPTGNNPQVFDSLSHLKPQNYTAEYLNLFSLDFWLFKSSITRATFFLNYHFFGDSTAAINFVNIFFHALTALVLFLVVQETLKKRKQSRSIASFSSALFFIHPVAAHAVLYHVQRSIILATLFSLLAIYSFLKFNDRPKILWGIVTALFYGLALQSKQHAVMLPVFFVATVVFTFNKNDCKTYFKKNYWVFILLGLIAAHAVYQYQYVLASNYENWSGVIQQKLNPLSPESITDQTLSNDHVYARSVENQACLFFRYLGNMILPFTRYLAIDIPLVFPERLFLWPQTLVFPFFLLIPIATFVLAKKFKKPHLAIFIIYPWILFMTEISTVRFSEIFVLYRSYLWMALFIALPVQLLFFLPAWPKRILLTLYFCFTLYGFTNRVAVFSDRIRVWEDAVAVVERMDVKASTAYRPLVHLAGYYALSGRYTEAITTFNRAIEINPSFYLSYYNLANVYGVVKNYNKAIENYQQALTLAPQDVTIYADLIKTYLASNQTKIALDTCKKITALGIENAKAKDYCDKVIALSSDQNVALTDLQEMLIQNPDNLTVRLKLIGSLMLKEKYDIALDHLNYLYSKDPQNGAALYYLALIHKILGDKEKAAYFNEALAKSPKNLSNTIAK